VPNEGKQLVASSELAGGALDERCRDPRLVCLIEDEETGLELADFRGFLSANEGRTSALLACYLLTDSDPEIVDMIFQYPGSDLVSVTLPYWRDRPSAEQVLKAYRSIDFGGEDRKMAAFEALGGSEASDGSHEIIREINDGEDVDFQEFEILEDDMREALKSAGIEGTEAEIMIAQRSVTSEAVVGRWANDLKEAWSRGLSQVPEGERSEFALECLEASWKLDLPNGSAVPALLRVQAELAKQISASEVMIGDQAPGDFANELSQKAVDLEKRLQNTGRALFEVPPEVIDRYFELRRSDPVAAESFLLEPNK
jgi:hypothetical protein